MLAWFSCGLSSHSIHTFDTPGQEARARANRPCRHSARGVRLHVPAVPLVDATRYDPKRSVKEFLNFLWIQSCPATAVSQSCGLLAQREIVPHQRLSRAREAAKPPEGELEKEKHRRKMRLALGACKRTGVRPRVVRSDPTTFGSTARQME